MSLTDRREFYKPLDYPWALDAFLLQNKMHWMLEEVPLADDVKDWNHKLTEEEKNLLTQIFRFFTQGDIDVAYGYLHKYIPVFGHKPELAMMMSSFANMEGTHIHAYSGLLDTIGMPEVEYQAFAEYEQMAAKHDYLSQFTCEDTESTIKSLAVYSAFTEGLQLFSSFAILMNFQRFNKMKGMCTVVEWSIRDESLHVEYMTKLFRTFVEERYELWTDELKKEIYDICRKMVDLEDAFIDLAFEQGGIEGLTPEEVKLYIRYIADRRLIQLGMKPNYGVKDNPLEWLDWVLNGASYANFFESRATEYSKVPLVGDWGEVWSQLDE